jgi:sugar phosphate isomerase/epimerase
MDICVFSKHLQAYGYRELGARLKEAGFNGVDLTVRAGGHVEPGAASERLPEAASVLGEEGVAVTMITTDITGVDEPHARAVLEAAAALNINYWKPGYYRYDGFGTVRNGLAEAKAKLADLTALSAELGLWAGVHNHAGPYIGANPVHVRELISDLDPNAVGSYFDTGHSVLEGAFGGWALGLDELSERIRMVAVKDLCIPDPNADWPARVAPLGEGWVPWVKMIASLKRMAPRFGPVSFHAEYDRPAPEVLELVKADKAYFDRVWAEAE